MSNVPVPRPPGPRPPGTPAPRPAGVPGPPGSGIAAQHSPAPSTPPDPSRAQPKPVPPSPVLPTPEAPMQGRTVPDPDQPTLESAAPTGPTGHPGVDRALAMVADLPDLPVEDHAERLAAAHEHLHAALDEHRAGQD